MKTEILESGLKRLKGKMKSLRRLHGSFRVDLQLDWNAQVYAFMKLQLKAEKQWRLAELKREPTAVITKIKSREELALLVAKSGGWGTWVMRRILKQEVEFIRFGKEPVPMQGRHAKVTSWLTDEGTMLAMREYMSEAGEGMLILYGLKLVFKLRKILTIDVNSNGFSRTSSSCNQLLVRII